MEQAIINIEPIMNHIDFICLVIGVCLVLIILAFVFGRCYQDKLNHKKDIHFKDKDVEVVTDAFAKIGEVKNGTKNEVILNKQNVENNKEIHANNLKYDELEQRIEKIEKYMQDMNNNIQLQLKSILEEFSKK